MFRIKYYYMIGRTDDEYLVHGSEGQPASTLALSNIQHRAES
jgi:hypothetical protein